MSIFEFTTFINTLANAIASDLSDTELSLLAASLTQLGDTLATIAAFRESRSGEDIV